jgi:hypothetical protein
MSFDFKKQEEQTLEARPCTNKSLLIQLFTKEFPTSNSAKKIEQTIKNLSSLIRDVIKQKINTKNGPRTDTF